MSHKIHKSNVARQQAYRDRLKKKRHEEDLAATHRQGFHVGRTIGGTPLLPIKGCPLCTVTESQKNVAVTKPVTEVDPKKDLMKRFRATKRTAKFYVEMTLELRDGWDGNYGKFLEAYSDSQSYPWTPPQKDYLLPKTEEELQAQNDAAFAEFQKVSEEGKAMGVLVERREDVKL